MASRTTTRKRATSRKRSTARRPQAQQSRPLRTLIGRGARAAAGRARSIDAPDGLRREVRALLIGALALLILLPLVGVVEQPALVVLGATGLRWLLGQAAPLVPLGLAWWAAELMVGTSAAGRARRGIGYSVFALAVVTALGLIGGGDVSQAGGFLGHGLSRVFAAIGGEIGGFVITATLGLVGISLLSGAEPGGAVARAVRRLPWRSIVAARKRPVPERSGGEVAPPVQVVAHEPAAAVTAEVESRPVINIPQAHHRPRTASADAGGGPPSEQPDASDAPVAPVPLPDLSRLALYDGASPDAAELEEKARLIEETLASFKVEASVREIFPGPAVTLFALEPGPGVKVRRITELQNDLALALAARSIRIEAPVPGMARVGIEIPNSNILTVGLRETIESVEFESSSAKIPLALGRDVNGSYMVADLAKMPHLLIAGSTGSGKSVCINGIIATFLLTRRPEELQMVLVDPKMVELLGFNGVPHLRCPVVTDMDKVVGVLRLVLKEMEDRYQRFSTLGVRNIDGYNLRREDDPSLEPLPYIVVIVDELADLMMTTPEDVESLLVRLAQMARATGIHLLIATQRPSVDVLTGLIKANVPARIAFAVTSQTDSRVILDMPGAERLLGKGDMLLMPPDAAKPHRVQGSFIEDKDLQYLVRYWRAAVPNHTYDPAWVNLSSGDNGGEDGEDPLMEQAVRIVRAQGTASASMLQRRLRIGYNRAARLIERMEDEGIVGPADGARGRPVYITDDE